MKYFVSSPVGNILFNALPTKEELFACYVLSTKESSIQQTMRDYSANFVDEYPSGFGSPKDFAKPGLNEVFGKYNDGTTAKYSILLQELLEIGD